MPMENLYLSFAFPNLISLTALYKIFPPIVTRPDFGNVTARSFHSRSPFLAAVYVRKDSSYSHD